MSKNKKPATEHVEVRMKTFDRTATCELAGSKKGILAPNTTVGRQPVKRVELGLTKKQCEKCYKKRKKAYRHASDGQGKLLRTLLDFPAILKDTALGAQLFLLMLFVRVADFCELKLPVIQLGPISTCPEALKLLLAVMQGPTQWRSKKWMLKRPWVMTALQASSFTSPSTLPIDYIGGYWTDSFGKKRRFWFPYVSCAFAASVNVPGRVLEEIIVHSPYAIPFLCGQKVRVGDRTLHQLDGTAMTCIDEERLGELRNYKLKNLYWLVSGFFKGYRKKLRKKLRKGKTVLAGDVYIPKKQDGCYTQTSADPWEQLMALSLDLLNQFLMYVADEGWLTQSECEEYLTYYWSLALPDSAPKSSTRSTEGQWKDPVTFGKFLHSHLENAVLAAPGEARTSQLEAAVATVSNDLYLILPRDACLASYGKWLNANGMSCVELNNNKGNQVQKLLMDAGIPLKHEKDEHVWRYMFYASGQAPDGEKEKLPCLGLRYDQLSDDIKSILRTRLGDKLNAYHFPSDASGAKTGLKKGG